MSTHYEALDVAPDASPSEVKKAWRKIAFDCHPDRAGVRGLSAKEEGKRAERFKKGIVAWEVLGDEAARKAYDQELKAEVRQEKRKARTARAQAYGETAWQKAEKVRQKLHREFIKQEQQRAWRNAQRQAAQAERRAKARQRAADQQADWERAYDDYLTKIVDNLRCEIASYILDDRDA